jgi:hypothetical protein
MGDGRWNWGRGGTRRLKRYGYGQADAERDRKFSLRSQPSLYEGEFQSMNLPKMDGIATSNEVVARSRAASQALFAAYVHLIFRRRNGAHRHGSRRRVPPLELSPLCR